MCIKITCTWMTRASNDSFGHSPHCFIESIQCKSITLVGLHLAVIRSARLVWNIFLIKFIVDQQNVLHSLLFFYVQPNQNHAAAVQHSISFTWKWKYTLFSVIPNIFPKAKETNWTMAWNDNNQKQPNVCRMQSHASNYSFNVLYSCANE